MTQTSFTNRTHDYMISIPCWHLHLCNELHFQYSFLCSLCPFNIMHPRLCIPLETVLKFPIPFFSVFWSPRFIHSAISSQCLSPSFKNLTILRFLLVALPIHLGLLRVYDGLRDAQQRHQAIMTRIPCRTQVPRETLPYHLCSYHTNTTWHKLLYRPPAPCAWALFSYLSPLLIMSRACPAVINIIRCSCIWGLAILFVILHTFSDAVDRSIIFWIVLGAL